MKENLTPEQKEIETKKTVIENLERAFLVAETCVSSIRYMEDLDIVHIRHTDGFSVCISAEGKNALALLFEAIYELKPFLHHSFANTGWYESFGPSGAFMRGRLK